MGVRKELEETFDYEIVDEFLDHFAMVTDEIELLTIQLEKPEYYVRNVDELFRIFHNVKSATAFLHISVINKFAISVEDLLERMRGREGPASPAVVDWLIACDDHMTQWNDNLRLDEELSPVPEILKTLPKLD
jgi:two-component system chemotaxis sensor kinase CheA